MIYGWDGLSDYGLADCHSPPLLADFPSGQLKLFNETMVWLSWCGLQTPGTANQELTLQRFKVEIYLWPGQSYTLSW